MPFILGANETKVTGYNVANSVRFNSADNAYMGKTSGANGTSTSGTFSCWLKRGNLGVTSSIMSQVEDANNFLILRFTSGDALDLRWSDAGSGTDANLTTTQVFRDCSSWINIVVKFLTSDSTEANRVKIYVNGTQVTSFSSSDYPTQNDPLYGNVSSGVYRIGDNGFAATGEDFDGYMAEVVWLDGTSTTASDFGEFNEDSPRIWQPVDVSGLTFGTNGFYLDFEDSSNLGNDIADNGDWTEANLAAADQATDTCTNNFCTMNPLHPTTAVTFSEGNCKYVTSGDDNKGAGIGTFGLTAGKWYYEVKIASLVDNHTHGAISELTTELYSGAGGTQGLQNDTGVTSWINGDGGEVVVDGTATTNDYGLYTDGQIMGVALDIDNYNITYLRNGSALVSDFNMSTTRGTIFPFIKSGINTTSEVNFGGCSAFSLSSAQSDENGYGNFEHAPPSGYLAICSKNLGSDGG